MRILLIALFTFVFASTAHAGHSRGNNTCDDDKLHYDNMTVNGKRSDAPLYAESQAWYHKAINKHNYWKCEQYTEEALRMIRKDGDGNYPTE